MARPRAGLREARAVHERLRSRAARPRRPSLGRHQLHERRGLHQRARVLHGGAQQALVRSRRVARARAAARISAFWWLSRRSATGMKSVRRDAPSRSSAQHHLRRGWYRMSARDQPHASLVGQQVERRHHLHVVAAVESREQGLQRLQVQLGRVGVARAWCPGAARCGTARGGVAAGRWPRRSRRRTGPSPPARHDVAAAARSR